MAEAERRQILRERYSHRSKRSVIGTPPPVKGRRHETIQTDRFLEELFIKPNEYSVECQTDLYLYEPSCAPHVPAKSGIDASTGSDDSPCVNDTDTEYDVDIVSILDILVELAMKQAIYEFLHEEEMADEQMEAKHLLALEHIQRSTSELDGSSKTTIIGRFYDQSNATALLHGYLSTLLPDVLVSLDDVDIKRAGLNDIDCVEPWLANEIAMEVGGMIDSRESLEKLIKNIVETRATSNVPNTNE